MVKKMADKTRKMADWNSLTTSPERNGDFMSLFTTKTSSPLYRMNGHLSELQFSPSPHRNLRQHGNEQFCHKDNVDDCVSLINQEVTTLGMDSLYEKNSEVFDTVRLVNCTQELLQRHQRSSRIREELENRKHRTEVDIQNLHLAHSKLKATLEQNDRNLRQLQEKERQLINKNKLLVSRLKMEKEEVKKLQSVIQHRDTQFKHEIKKKERELIKLKDRIHLLLTDKTEKRIGLEIANPLPRSDGKRGTWKTGNKQEEEMYRSVISNYEDKQKDLMVENTELRQCLRDMQKELVGLLNTPDSSVGVSTCNSTPEMRDLLEMTEEEDLSEADALSEAHFEMPYEFIRGDIEKSLKEKYKLLKDYIRKVESKKGVLVSAENISQHVEVPAAPKAPSTPVPPVKEDKYQREVEKLNKQIGRYRDIIEQQEKLLQNQLDMAQEDPKDLSILQTSELYEEKEKLETDRKFFQEQKTNFEEERKRFTEAAIRLTKERKEFEVERTTFLQNQFLQITPFREANKAAEKAALAIGDPIPMSTATVDDEDTSVEKAETDCQTEKVTKVTQTGGSLSPVDSSHSADNYEQSPVQSAATAKGISLEDINEVPNSEPSFPRKPRSKRLLPATPTSTPAPNSTPSSGSSTTHPLSSVPSVPRVMARPHSSIAIADGAPDSSTHHMPNLPSHSSSMFAPRTLRPRSSAPSTAELYKKLGLEPPKDRSQRERSSRHTDSAVYHTPSSRENKPIVPHLHIDELHHSESQWERSRSNTENSATSSGGGGSRGADLTSSSQEYVDKENRRERSRDSGIGAKETARDKLDRDRYYELRRSRHENELSSRDRSVENGERRSSSRRERSKDRERSWERKRERSSDEERQHTRPHTAREHRHSSLERSSSFRERPKTAKDPNIEDSSRRKSMSSKDLDRHDKNRYSLGRESSFDYSNYSRDRYSKDERERSRERRDSRPHEVTRSHSSAGHPWRQTYGNYPASPLVLRNPEQTQSRSSSNRK